MPATLEKKSPSLYLIQFEVEQAGNYALDVAVSGRRLVDCPVACKAYDAARIQLTQVPQIAEVGKAVMFHGETSWKRVRKLRYELIQTIPRSSLQLSLAEGGFLMI